MLQFLQAEKEQLRKKLLLFILEIKLFCDTTISTPGIFTYV